MNWDEIIKKATNIFQSGADIVLGSTFSMVQSIFSGVTTFVIGFVFACYILIQKEKLGRQCRKLLFAYLKKQQAERVLEIAYLTAHLPSSSPDNVWKPSFLVPCSLLP